MPHRPGATPSPSSPSASNPHPTDPSSSFARPGTAPPGGKASSQNGLLLLVFIADNAVTNMAVDMALTMARAGRDQLLMVTVVASDLDRRQGLLLVEKHYSRAVKMLHDTTAEVVVRG